MFYLKELLMIGVILISGCSSIDKAQLVSEEPNDAILEVQRLMKNSKASQFDLLATDQFEKGEKLFNKAKQQIGEDNERDYIIETLSQSKAHFIEAQKVALGREIIPTRVISARKSALKSGVFESDQLEKRMDKTDDLLRYETSQFSEGLSVEELSEFERDYLLLEVDSVQNRELSTFRRVIENARKDNASRLAPNTYHNAVNDLKAAENMIQQSSRNPENYRASVTESDKSSKLLSDVMKKLKGVAKGSSEAAVLELVHQERKLGHLSERNSNLEGSLSRSKMSLSDTSDKLAKKTDEAQRSENKVLIQNAMNDMRANFTSEEADVYQQGDNLIIRLKKMDFGVGSAQVPNNSKNLLSKVNSAILKLNAPNITIEGHTDYTGNNSLNQNLSVQRSESVAQHLKTLGKSQYQIQSKGYGETRPIANNQTKDGRTMNRRVDIVVDTSTKL